jgi:hypothetical protein
MKKSSSKSSKSSKEENKEAIGAVIETQRRMA